MANIAPLHLLNLAGLPATAQEPHLPRGNHLRVTHHPGLGLPVAPFILQRAQFDGLPDTAAPRRDVVLHDGAGRLLSLPLVLDKGQTVFATIPQGPGASCVCAMVAADPAASPVLPRPMPVPMPRPIPRPMPSLTRPAAPVLDRDWLAGALAGLVPAAPGPVLSATMPQIRAPSPHVAAYGSAFGGDPALLAARAEAPYTLAAPGIAELRITGPGRITDIAWMAAQDLDQLRWSSIEMMHLPREHGMRYLSIKGAKGRAHDAVAAQAPMRRPLHELDTPLAPDAAPSFADHEELDRVTTIGAPLMADLDVLIDGSEPPLLAAETYELTDDDNNRLAGAGDESNVSVGHLARVMQAALDPGIAALMGYKAIEPGDDRLGGLAIYRVIGFFRDPADLGADQALLDELALPLVQERDLGGDTVEVIIRKLAGDLMRQKQISLTGRLDTAPRHFRLDAIAVVDRRAPLLPPAPPRLMPPEPGPWHPAPAPAALRRIDLPLAGVAPGALLALHRQQGPSAPAVSLNPEAAGGWHMPMALGLAGLEDDMPLADADGRDGTLSDPEAGEAAARYHVAQQDPFGRWSAPAAVLAPAGIRPLPPQPVLQGSYLPPDPALAATTGGMVHLHVPLPDDDALAPGSLRLSFLRLHFQHEPAQGGGAVPLPSMDIPVSAAIAVDQGSPTHPPRRVIPASLQAPVLAQAQMRRMIVTATWHDSAARASVLSRPLRLPMADPRPPAQMPIAEPLLYSGRPDATGLAWVERGWSVPVSDPPHHAVYYSDEVRMLSWLRRAGRRAEADRIAAVTDRAQRAGMLRAIQSDFPDDLFERLPDAVEQIAPGQRRFRHAVSGSSRVLNAYRIATEAPGSGARPALSGLDMVFYAVPNSDPPPRPSVSVRMVAAGPQDQGAALVAEVSITLEPGVTPPLRVRLHRTRGGPADPMSAPVVAEWALPVGSGGQQVQTFRDIGRALIAPNAELTPYAPYRWFALVQGAPESGSSLPGLWSAPSDPAGLSAIPPEAPGPARLDRIEAQPVPGGFRDLVLVVAHPFGLAPTPQGAWRFEAFRADPGEEWQAFAQGEVRQADLRIADPVTGGVTAAGTLFLVLLTDPLGRPLAPLEIEAR